MAEAAIRASEGRMKPVEEIRQSLAFFPFDVSGIDITTLPSTTHSMSSGRVSMSTGHDCDEAQGISHSLARVFALLLPQCYHGIDRMVTARIKKPASV
jgi:hypothetical protein